MQQKPKGGRGHKAPYKTKTVRVPEPILYQIETLCDTFRQASLEGTWDSVEQKDLLSTTTPLDRLTKEQAIEEAKAILKRKRSARVSLEMFLRVLYGDKEIKL